MDHRIWDDVELEQFLQYSCSEGRKQEELKFLRQGLKRLVGWSKHRDERCALQAMTTGKAQINVIREIGSLQSRRLKKKTFQNG